MQKRLLSLLILAFICFHSAFAEPRMPGKSKNKLEGSTALFVLNGGDAYNKAMQEIIPKIWTITPYKFIGPGEVSRYFGNDNYSLVMRETYQVDGSASLIYSYIQVFRGLKNMKKISLTSSVQNEAFPEVPESTLMVYLPNYFERLQLDCINSELTDIRANRKEKAKDVATKTFYILESQIKKNPTEIKEKAAKYYPYKIEYVDESQLEEAIYNQDSSVCYTSDICLGGLSVINAGSGALMVTFNVFPYPGEVNAEFFRAVVRQVGKPK